MKQRLFLLLAFLLVSAFVNAQDKKIPENELPDALLKYLDPNYPVYLSTGDKFADDESYRTAMHNYSEQHPPFPEYKNNGNPEQDMIMFDRAKQVWYFQNPYFPQFIDTGKPAIDSANYRLATREWKNHFQMEYKELFNAIYEDSELREKYSFIIQN